MAYIKKKVLIEFPVSFLSMNQSEAFYEIVEFDKTLTSPPVKTLPKIPKTNTDCESCVNILEKVKAVKAVYLKYIARVNMNPFTFD